MAGPLHYSEIFRQSLIQKKTNKKGCIDYFGLILFEFPVKFKLETLLEYLVPMELNEFPKMPLWVLVAFLFGSLYIQTVSDSKDNNTEKIK